jgi:hypothetical protein
VGGVKLKKGELTPLKLNDIMSFVQDFDSSNLLGFYIA